MAKRTDSLKLVIAIPTYNGAGVIGETLKSILSQSFGDFSLQIVDDASTDNTVAVIEKFTDPRIRITRRRENLGFAGNLKALSRSVKGDILFLMGQDDILLKDALKKTYRAFLRGEAIGAVTRPYYWFDEDAAKPVRVVTPYNEHEDAVISLSDGEREVRKIFESLGQLSGLAYRLKYLTVGFHEECFPAHIYPFAGIARDHPVVFLKDYTVAVQIGSSQTRFKSSIYDISPTLSWVKMFRTVFAGEKYREVRKTGIEQMAAHFVGLVQLKNYSTFGNLIREIFILVKLRPRNLINLKFWFYALGTILIPRKALIWLVDNFKKWVLSRRLAGINADTLDPSGLE